MDSYIFHSIRRDSIPDHDFLDRVRNQSDDMNWLGSIAAEFEDKDTEQLLYPTSFPSPASNISSGSSSSLSSVVNSPVHNHVVQSIDSDSDAKSDSDPDSDVDPSRLPVVQYKVINELAYPISTPPFSNGIQDTPYIPSEHPHRHPYPVENASRITLSALAVPTLPLSPKPRRTTTSFSSFFDPGEDADAEGEPESDANASDDEYFPSPTLLPRKRRRVARRLYPSHTPNTFPSYEIPDLRPVKRVRRTPACRNLQTSPISLSSSSSAPKTNPWACPYCSWVQSNHRTPDLKRHIRTHTRLTEPPQWVCCGLPREQARDKTEPLLLYNGVWMVGGCGKTFSRRDALKRHLDNNNITCSGDLKALTSFYD